MNASPTRADLLPAAAAIALGTACNFTMSATVGLDGALTILDALLTEAREEDNTISAPRVENLCEQIEWIIERLNADLDALRVRLTEAGWKPSP